MKNSEGYQKEDFEFVSTIEDGHFWYIGRRFISDKLLGMFRDAKNEKKILDVGCGNGAMTETLNKYGRTFGLDPSLDAAEKCAQKGCLTVQGDAVKLPYQDHSFDWVVIFDCLEHIGEDYKVIKECNRILKPNGLLFVFVPAFQFLWNFVDVYSFHVRRYSKKSLIKLIAASNFAVIFKSYYMLVLFPVLLSCSLRDRYIRKKGDRTRDWKNKLIIPSRPINALLVACLKLEAVISCRIGLPLGTTLMMVVEKKGTVEK